MPIQLGTKQKFGQLVKIKQKRNGECRCCVNRTANELLKGDLQKEATKYGIEVEVIDMQAYGLADGQKAYEQALTLMGES